MKTTFVSSKAISEATRLSMLRMQSKLVAAQTEVTTGRLADVGKTLGFQAGQTVSLRQEHTRLTSMLDVNAATSTRLDMTQTSLTALLEDAQSFVSQLIAARDVDIGPSIIKPVAEGSLVAAIDTLNGSLNGAYVFSGINADIKPVSEYFQDPPGANQQAVAAEFLAAFGVTQSDAGVSAITPADMQTFLDGAFADLFAPPRWTTEWSSASDQDIRSRISTYELVETSTNVNEPAFRKLISAYTMISDLGVENMDQPTFQTVMDTAIRVVGEAIKDLSEIKGKLGVVEERVAKSNEKMSIQIDIISAHIGTLEGVDPYEASTRISTIMTQIETAYALTARIQKLSLLNYL